MTENPLPPGLEPIRRIGEGRRSLVYRARRGSEEVAVKVYRQEFIDKYRARYGVNIAEFEFQRNRDVHGAPGLSAYAARPVAVVGGDGEHALAFVQELIEGISLVELGRSQRGLPDSVLAAGDVILAAAETAGLFDLDLYFRNILVREREGLWQPVLHDFNLMPQYLFPPNPFLALAYLTGIRRKSHRDRRCIAQWRKFSEACRRGRPYRD